MDTSQLCFNIIYIRGTVKRLTVFLDSLLQWSDCQFRLVANGCSSEEIAYLRDLCERNTRLQCYVFPSSKVALHSTVLNHLQLLDKDKAYFCFLDSDIFAIGHFLNGLSCLTENYVGFFSGAPIWVKEEEYHFQPTFDIVGGYYHFMENNICLGSTFFSIYKNEALNQVINETGVGFQGYLAKDIPKGIAARLEKLKLLKDAYDTGKLLNLLLQVNGHKIIYQDKASLVHVGGIFFDHDAKMRSLSLKRKLVEAVVGKDLGDKLFLFFRKHIPESMPHITNKAERKLQAQQAYRRDLIRDYMTRLVDSLISNTESPKVLVTNDAELDVKLRATSKALALIYERA